MTTLKQKLIVSLEKRIYNVEEFADEIVNFQKEILLNRLREQYKDFYSTKYSREKEVMYNAMRLFCLDTQLVSFNDIEVMEYEVNSSLNEVTS